MNRYLLCQILKETAELLKAHTDAVSQNQDHI